MHAAFEQLLRYRNGRPETKNAGLREGEPRLFHSNLLLVRTCGERCEFGTITSGHEHFHAWKDNSPESPRPYTHPPGCERQKALPPQRPLPPPPPLLRPRTAKVFLQPID